MKIHPFAPERQVGVVYEVEGSFLSVAFSEAGRLPKSYFGESLGRGEVGQFLVVDVGGIGAFGRVLKVGTPLAQADSLERTGTEHHVPVQGQVQLLSTLRLDGSAFRGVAKYPRVGDPVYAASAEAIGAVLDGGATGTGPWIDLGRLSVDETVSVNVPFTRLFGRHLAIVGATGSGKSWTLAHLIEGVIHQKGKLILIDATGEFHTLGASAKHIAFGGTAGEPEGTLSVGIPHYRMRESDRNAFLNPSSGSQLPKLREAVRSLRIAHAIVNDPGADSAHVGLIKDGTIKKAGILIADFGRASHAYNKAAEDPDAPFDIKRIANQIQWECIWPTEKDREEYYGKLDYQQIGYVSSLVSRMNDLTKTPEIMGVIDPASGAQDALQEVEAWLQDATSSVLRISLRNLTSANHLREIIVNIVGQSLLGWARSGRFRLKPLVVSIDEAHQFFDVTVGDEFANTHLNAFDSIAKEGRKYGLTTCLVTQRPSDLPASVFSQVGMTIVHRLADGRDRQRIEQAAAELDQSATRLLPGLVPGEAVLMGVDFPVPVSVRINRPLRPPESDGPNYTNWS